MEIPWKCLFSKEEEPLPIAESTMIDKGMFFFLYFNSAHKRKEEGRVKLFEVQPGVPNF